MSDEYLSEIPDEEQDEDEYSESYELYCLGNQALEDDNYYMALSYFLMSKDIDVHYKTLEKIAETLKILKLNDNRHTYIEQAYMLQPTSDKTAVMYVETLVEKGEIESARGILNAVLSRNPTYGPAKKLLGEFNS